MNDATQFFSGGGYKIERSLRFNSSDSAYLSRTPSTAGNRKTWTWAGWVKRSALGDHRLFSNGNALSNNIEEALGFRANGTLEIWNVLQNVSFNWRVATSAVFRDTSAWYHIVVKVDTTQATASDRVIIYINGVSVTSYSLTTYPTQNSDLTTNSTVVHNIGASAIAIDSGIDGYLADIHFIDGQALDPTSFGEFDDNGVWQPIEYTGTYPGNSFHLPFSDNSTAAALGTDTSGNSNTWTVNNISVAAGSGNDSLVDTPTNYGTDTGAGGEVRGNYCTLNPLDISERYIAGTSSISNGNLQISNPGNSTWVAHSTFVLPPTGKYYFEATVDTRSPITNGGYVGVNGILYSSDGFKNIGGAWSTYAATYNAGDVIGVAANCDSNQVTFYKNGASQGAISASGQSFAVAGGEGAGFSLNFGQRPFAYPVSGYKALCTTNLPDPQTITTSGSYTGNGGADGPFVYLNGVPTAMTVNGNAVTFGTHADKLSNGFKIRTTSTTYNQNASTYNYSITSTGDPFKTARAQSNP